MEDIFNTDFTMDENSQPPKMTKDEFIQKTRSMLQAIMDGYSSNWKDKYNEDDEESEENTCSRCNGFLYICEGGVGDVDCPSCKGTGLNNERVFDTENFVEFIEHGVIFGEQPFLDLLHCEIVNTEQNGSACV
jgi:DnaJ-class molecular chaperone